MSKSNISNAEIICDTLKMYHKFDSIGLTNIGGADRVEKPDDMNDFIVNLERLGYGKSMTWLRQGQLNTHSSGQLSLAYSFLQNLKNEYGVSDDLVNPQERVVFINHSSKDKVLAYEIKKFIDDITGEKKLIIFCSSDNESIPLNEKNYHALINKKLINTSLGISILSKTYVDSIYSLMELGYLYFDENTKLSALTLDSHIDTSSLLGPLSTMQIVELSSDINRYLNSLIDDLIDIFKVDIKNTRHDIVNNYVESIDNILNNRA